MSLKRETFKYIESEVYDLPATKKEIELRRQEILYPFDEEPDSNNIKGAASVRTISDTTSNTATLLVEDRKLKRMEDVASAIMKVYDSLIDEKKEIIKLYYWQKPRLLTWDGVAEKTHTPKRTALRWRRSFIHDIAKELGER